MSAVGRGRSTVLTLAALLLGAALAACQSSPAAEPAPSDQAGGPASGEPPRQSASPSEPPADRPARSKPPRGEVTLGFAGDIHFELHLSQLLAGPAGRLGPVTPLLRRPDVMMVNLETAITTRGAPEPKDFTFRTSPKALDVLAAAGVDVVTLANNHGVDYGAVGLADTLAAIERSPVPVVGIGRDVVEAFRPHRVSIGTTRMAFFGVSQRPDHTFGTWRARPDRPGIATSIEPRPRLLDAVRRADRAGEVVVVYLHWGEELQSCPTPPQRRMAAALARAGADVVVGTHAHVLLGAGWLGKTYVSYGLGNFIWYHDRRPDSGVLTVRIKDGEVVEDALLPAQIRSDGRPYPLTGSDAVAAEEAWRALRGCAGLAAEPATG